MTLGGVALTSLAPKMPSASSRRAGERAAGGSGWTVFHLPSTPGVFRTVGSGGCGHDDSIC
ncbi:hypothetical protein BAE44_0017452 [Dichanthelium oligosanthes]|uniref:Uncharacterized protein n=1 Tax=Dichanthelium oligosanthes TaxID=888268 RepID=A0A1E5V8T0_9POAL|nr:hypothetical protein BAE44_0017452 [Dichanthelium oligosanthes]